MTFEPGDRVKYIGGTTSFIENLYGTVVERDGYTFPLVPEDSVPVEWDDREGDTFFYGVYQHNIEKVLPRKPNWEV